MALEINLQHGKLTWDAATSSWLLFWVHRVGATSTEHRDHVGGASSDDMPTLGRLAGRKIPRDMGPITGTIHVDGANGYRGWIEVVGSQIDSTWAGR